MQPLYIGKAMGLGEDDQEEPLRLTADDLTTHVHGIGGTRSGKSKLIEWMAREFIRRRHGCCRIEPPGTLYNDLVSCLANPVTVRKEVILFDPSSTTRVVGFNPFGPGDEELTARVTRLIRATVKAWGAIDTDETPRLERWLRCSYHTLLEGGYTLDAMKYLMTWARKAERDYLTSKVTDELVMSEWETLADYKRAVDFDGQLESTRSRMFRFLHSKQISRVMGLSSNALDIGRIIEDGKILLVNLQPSSVLSVEQAEVLGTLLVDELWHHTQKRRARPRDPFFLIIDEFQKFLTPDIPDMLDEAAKRGVHLMLFHQRLDQLKSRDPEAYSAVMTNARTKLVFGALSREDAHTMVQEIFPGQVDLQKVKYTIKQTKFWPVYERDVVLHKGRGTGSGSSVGDASGMRDVWDPGTETWTSMPSSVSSTSATHQDVETEGSADIPIFMQEPFTEESSRQTYTLEELLWQFSDRLMLQYQRHFMVRRPGRETLAAVTPYVKSWHLTPETIERYIERCLEEYPSVAEVDASLQRERDNIKRAAADWATKSEPRILSSSAPRRRRTF